MLIEPWLQLDRGTQFLAENLADFLATKFENLVQVWSNKQSVYQKPSGGRVLHGVPDGCASLMLQKLVLMDPGDKGRLFARPRSDEADPRP